jgi:hypothetical protein
MQSETGKRVADVIQKQEFPEDPEEDDDESAEYTRRLEEIMWKSR